MADLVFLFAYFALIAASIFASRSLSATAVVFFAGFTFSGVLLQYLADSTLDVTYSILRIWLLATLIAIAAVIIGVRGRISLRWSAPSNGVLLGLSGGIALLFSLSRIIAPGSPTPLSSVGYFLTRVAAEDNAKWLNATATLANGSIVDSWANVGGPLLLVLSFSATFIASISFVLYGAVNEVAVSSGSLLFAELLLIVLAPLALAPLAEKQFKKLGRNRVPWPLIAISGLTFAAGVAVLLTYGHLTLEYTLLGFVLWLSVFLAPDTAMPWRKVTTLAIVGTAMVWFPLSGLAVILLLGLSAYLIISITRSGGTKRLDQGLWLVSTLILAFFMFTFLVSSLKFSLGFGATTAQVYSGGVGGGIAAIAFPTLPLFSDPGGTEKITVFMLALAILGVLSAVWFRSGRSPLTFSVLLPYLPILVLVFFLAGIFLADFWSVGEGPNYAALKMGYAVLLPIMIVTIPYLILSLPSAPSITSMGLLRWFGIGLLVLVLSFDTLFPRALMQLKPSIWPSTADSPYWYPAEVRATGEQSLVSNPIGCLYLPRGAEQPSALPSGQRAYSCTRLLSGIAGVEVASAPIVKWQLDEWLLNTTLWEERFNELSALPQTTLNRSFILLDGDSNVVGVETLGNLLNRYRPLPETAS